MMTKAQIKDKLWINHTAFYTFILSLTDNDFLFSPQYKWTAGQQLDHIHRSVSPLVTGLSLPKLILKMIFGKSNRPSKEYDAVIKKYHLKIEAGGKASGRFIPPEINPGQKYHLKNKLISALKKLNSRIDKFTEEELDEFILPHPLLGKITIREMLYFTIYHVEHHHQIIKKYF